ncbi:unnamed protein product [Schistocephalus solidus]|uniref:Ral GTPase-activating protein subunit alpha-2 n=1 Tax=Schistocephalus solidus TaxID=70667 RepID=A0A183T8L7_SCHSO|nr:unnamed protein product [Schistocephalus solidus]
MAVSSATSMLPPIRTPSLHLGPCNGGGGGGGPRMSGTPSQGNCYDTQTHLHSPPGLRSNSNTTSDSGTPPANLTEESMMVLSQSIDSIHTMGTSGGSESLDVSPQCLYEALAKADAIVSKIGRLVFPWVAECPGSRDASVHRKIAIVKIDEVVLATLLAPHVVDQHAEAPGGLFSCRSHSDT